MMGARRICYEAVPQIVTEGSQMLCEEYYETRLSIFDEEIFRALVPRKHFVR